MNSPSKMLYCAPAGTHPHAFMKGLVNIRILGICLSLWFFAPVLHAEVDAEISKQIKAQDSALSNYEKALKNKRKRLSLDDLKLLQQTVVDIKSLTNACITANQEAINKIEGDFKLIGEAGNHEDRLVAAQRKSLNKVLQQHEAQLGGCRVLLLRASQISDTATEQQQALVSSQLFRRSDSILDHLQANIVNPVEGFDALVDFVVSTSGLELVYEHRYWLSLFIVVSVIGTLLMRALFDLFIARHEAQLHSSFARMLLIALVTCSKHYMLTLLLTGTFAAYFLYLGLISKQFPFVALISIGLFLYVFLTLVLRVILSPVKPATSMNALQKNVAEKLMRRLRLLAKLLFVGFLVFAASELHDFPAPITGLLRNIYVALLILNLCWAFWLLGNIRGIANTRLIRTVITLALSFSLLADWAGYNNLSAFILVGIGGSIAVWFLTHLTIKLWTDFFDSMDDGEYGWQQFIRRKIGVKKGDYLPGSFWFRFTFSIVVWSIFAIAMLKIWGLSNTGLLAIQDLIANGFNIGPVQIVPSKLIFALLLFALLLSLVGWVKRGLQKSWLSRSRLDRGSKESMITLTGYIGIVAAFIIALSMAGVELANLALIAGALSVGIGFGLQNVVNNFVSGIVLLFERPIKTGDWIVVGGTQGYVRKIQLRSTIIETFDRADIIVPNAEIIASQVTNWMLNDTIGRIKVPIRAAYGTDPNLVKKILIEIAHAHPEAITRSKAIDPPWVLFLEFGDSAMLFELRFFVTNVDYHMAIISDINFAIAEAFKREGIVVPYPQTDFHLKSGARTAFDTDK